MPSCRPCLLYTSRTYSRVTDAAGNIVLDNQPKTHVAMKSSTATNITSLLYSAANSGTGRESIFSGQAIAGKTGTCLLYTSRCV